VTPILERFRNSRTGKIAKNFRANPLILSAPSKGKNPVYYILGQTQSGRYLFSVVVYFGKGKGYVVTARDMTGNERRRFSKWRQK